MKTTFLFLLIVTTLVCCKKDSTNPAGTVLQVRVLEYKTGTPLANVKADLYSCIPPPGRTNCDTGHLILTGYTDANGIFASTEFYHAVFGVTLTKDNYITSTGGTGDRYMYPAAYINLHLIKENTYADTTAFAYYLDSALAFGSWNYIIPPPADTIIRLQLPGDSTYTIYSGVAILPNCTADTCRPGWLATDTIYSLRLAKFGDSTVTIRY